MRTPGSSAGGCGGDDEAREEGANERNALLIKVFKAAANPDPKYAALQAWGDKMLRQRRAAGFADDARLTSEQQTALLRGTLVAADPGAAQTAPAARASPWRGVRRAASIVPGYEIAVDIKRRKRAFGRHRGAAGAGRPPRYDAG
jgi:hypothetical protein